MKIFVIGHKKFLSPIDDKMYIPMIVGVEKNVVLEYELKDDSGENIASKNGRYNELTGIYWVWKNVIEDVVGICHYRRYFVLPRGKILNLICRKHKYFVNEEYIKKKLQKKKIILHNKTFFRVSNREQFCEANNPIYLEVTEKKIKELCPEYLSAYSQVMEKKYAHLLNMLITSKEVYDQYCEWLFPLLLAIENCLERMYPGDALDRALGMIAERLLDVWVEKNEIKYHECFSINMERVDWKIWC